MSGLEVNRREFPKIAVARTMSQSLGVAVFSDGNER